MRKITLKRCENREKIRRHIGEHPSATYRQIMEACNISSTAVVAHHLKTLRFEKVDVTKLKRENDSLKRENQKLRRKLEKATGAVRKKPQTRKPKKK